LETKSVIKTQRHYTIVIQFGKDPPSASAIWCKVQQFQETCSVLRRKGARRPSALQKDVDWIQVTFSRAHKTQL
jgi:hypothetical protein